MPMYKFKCKKCGHQFYKSLEMRNLGELKPACPVCKSLDITQIVSPVGIQFKGTGGTAKGNQK